MKFPKQRHHRKRRKAWTSRAERQQLAVRDDVNAFEQQAAKYRKRRKRLKRTR